MPNTDPSDLDLSAQESEELFSTIGKIVVIFQQVELWLAEALAGSLSLGATDDRYVIISALSFKQKVDLLGELYPRKKIHYHDVEIGLVKKALYAAEEFRNRIVHSIWGIEYPDGWRRTKSSIKGRNGFSISSVSVNISQLNAAAKELQVIRDWELSGSRALEKAILVMRNEMI